MKKIPRNVIEEIEQRSDIVDIVGSYVTLIRAGSNLKGLCPFHSEKSPSFVVYPANNSFYCFGCGAGGNVFTFVMKAENLDFFGAVEFLANRAGIKLPQDSEYERDDSIFRNRVFQINLEAAKYFRQCLFSPIGNDAMQYLTEQRKLSGAVIKHFGLGYSPDSFSDFGNYMRSKGFTNDELKQSDLLSISEKNGRYYSRFRNRVMFPIIDTSGNIIAFGGRVMTDIKPKYLNSADTPGFKKSRNLFALNYAKNHCSESIILCEGYMDVIAMHAAGFENAVATLGTAITSEQARIIARYTKKVILIYDSDEAGQKATERALRLLGEVGLEVRVLKLNDAKDPDEYIKKFGRNVFAQQLNGSKSGFEHKLDGILGRYDISDTESRIRATREICTAIAEAGTNVEREVYISIASAQLGISAESIQGDVERIRKKKHYEYKKNQGKTAIDTAKKYGDTVNSDAAKNVAASSAEDVIIGMLLGYGEFRGSVASGKIELQTEHFFTQFAKKAFDVIMSLEKSDEGYSRIMLEQFFTADETGRLQSLERRRIELGNNTADVFCQAVQTLKSEVALFEASSSGDKLAELRMKREKNRINKKTDT